MLITAESSKLAVVRENFSAIVRANSGSILALHKDAYEPEKTVLAELLISRGFERIGTVLQNARVVHCNNYRVITPLREEFGSIGLEDLPSFGICSGTSFPCADAHGHTIVVLKSKDPDVQTSLLFGAVWLGLDGTDNVSMKGLLSAASEFPGVFERFKSNDNIYPPSLDWYHWRDATYPADTAFKQSRFGDALGLYARLYCCLKSVGLNYKHLGMVVDDEQFDLRLNGLEKSFRDAKNNSGCGPVNLDRITDIALETFFLTRMRLVIPGLAPYRSPK